MKAARERMEAERRLTEARAELAQQRLDFEQREHELVHEIGTARAYISNLEGYS